MAVTNPSVVDVTADIALVTSKPSIVSNFDDLLENDVDIEARLTIAEADIVALEVLTYADIYAIDNAVATALTTQNTWYQFLEFTNIGVSNNATPNLTTDDITIVTTGIYKVEFSVSFSGSSSSSFEACIFKNNGATKLENIIMIRKTGTGGDVGSASAQGVVSLTATDTVELWVRCTTGSSKTITVTHCNVSINKI